MEKTVERKRIVYFDVLNVLACFCVVGMHCNGAVHAFSDSSVWRQSLLVDVLAYLGSTGICYAFRCHVDELPQTIFHKGIFKTALSENWCSACDLDCVLLCFLSYTGDDRVDRMACIFK